MFDVRIVGAYLMEDGGDEITAYGEDEGRVSVGFPWDRDYSDDEDSRPEPTNPEAWCNAAGVEVAGDEVRVWISTGDPRGAFQMTARRMDDGTIILHMPYPGEGMPHEETVEIHPGTLAVKRSIPEGAEV
jgi:hypothetical protein